MENEIMKAEKKYLSLSDLKSQVSLIQQVLKEVMKKDVHYGIIPGCKKPSLYKAGAEYLLTLFRIAIEPDIKDLSTEDCVRYRVICKGIFMPDGTYLGAAAGQCSSDEDKYKWRSSLCDEEYEKTPDNRKRIKHKKEYGKVIKKKQIRTEPADLANTILKMAIKRAMVAFCLNATAASDVFDQDIEDLSRDLKNDSAPQPSMPQAKNTVISGKESKPPEPAVKSNLISDAQAKRLYAIATKTKSNEELHDYLTSLGIDSTKDIQKKDYENICNWAERITE